MSDDLVKQLRYQAQNGILDLPEDHVFVSWGEAADEIERLRAALEKIAQHDMQAIAMDALRPGERIRSADKGETP